VRFHAKVTVAALVLVGAAAALVFLFRSSEEEAIEELLRDGAAAASSQDAEAVIRLLSTSFKSSEGDHAWAVQRIRRALSQPVGQLEVSPGGIQVEGDLASARIRLRAKAGPYSTGEMGFDFRFRKEGGAWKVVSAEEIR
jgi:ketosteroid isomerase-like protein